VSDADGMIRVIDLTGQVTETIDIQGVDLEGIAFNDSNSTIYTVDESKGNLTAYTTKESLSTMH
jgi:sugar lactone lactonase YvrE